MFKNVILKRIQKARSRKKWVLAYPEIVGRNRKQSIWKNFYGNHEMADYT